MNDIREVAKFLWSFSPFIIFGVIAGPGPWRLPVALVVSLVLLFVSGWRQLRKGFVLPLGTLVFLLLSLAAVVAHNEWYLARLEIFAQGTILAIALVSLVVKRPFVLQYAREGADPVRAASPQFVRTCYIITVFWTAMFLIATAVAVARFIKLGLPEIVAHTLSLGSLVVGVVFTQGYKHWIVKHRTVTGGND